MNDQRPAMPDEDALDFPKTWLRHVHPRRGGIHVPPVELGEPEAARRLLEDAADRVDALVGEESAHPERSAAARRHLDGDPDPAGAAALASVAAPPRGRRMDAFLAFVDAWTADTPSRRRG